MAAKSNSNFIQKATSKNKGAFKAKAKAAGMSTQAYANKVTANPKAYPTKTVKEANLAKTLMGMPRAKKSAKSTRRK